MNVEIRKYDSSVGDDANEIFDRISTEEERTEIDLEVQPMQELNKTRKEKGLTQKELGKLSGLSQSSIVRIENGTYSPSLETISKVLTALGKRLYIGDFA